MQSRIRTTVHAAIGAALLLPALAACGGSGGSEVTADAPAASTEASTAPKATACQPVPQAMRDKIGAVLNGGAKVASAAAVRSADYERAYFVAVTLKGPGIEDADPAVFATNRLDGSGLVYAVGGMAHQFSDMGHGEDTAAKFSISSDGYSEAEACAKDEAKAAAAKASSMGAAAPAGTLKGSAPKARSARMANTNPTQSTTTASTTGKVRAAEGGLTPAEQAQEAAERAELAADRAEKAADRASEPPAEPMPKPKLDPKVGDACSDEGMRIRDELECKGGTWVRPTP